MQLWLYVCVKVHNPNGQESKGGWRQGKARAQVASGVARSLPATIGAKARRKGGASAQENEAERRGGSAQRKASAGARCRRARA